MIGVIICGGLLYLFVGKNSVDQTNQAQDLPLNTARNSTKATKSQKASDNYLIIEEWNVRMKLPKEIKDATYRYSEKYGLKTASLYQKLGTATKGCENSPVYAISRATSKDEAIADSGATVRELMSVSPDTIITLDGAYYLGRSGNGPCYDVRDENSGQQYRNLENMFGKAYESLEVIN